MSEMMTDLQQKVIDRLKEILPEGINFDYIKSVAYTYCTLPYTTPDMDIRDDNLLFVAVFPFLANIQYMKEGTYGRSWCKRGELDVFFNTARKFDRIENIMLKGAKDEVGESQVDTVGDLANYGTLWMTYILREYTEVFLEWAKNNNCQIKSKN